MRVRDLEWLVALAEHRHVTDTAAVLGVSQPTLSRALSRVEAEPGRAAVRARAGGPGDLAARGVRRRGEPGPGGALPANHRRGRSPPRPRPWRGPSRVPRLDGDLARAQAAARLPPGGAGGAGRACPRSRGTGSATTSPPEPSTSRSPRAGRASTSGGCRCSTSGSSSSSRPRTGCVTASGSALSSLAGEEMVMTPLGFGFRSLVDGLLADAGVAVKVSFESVDLATIEGLVAAGLGVAIVPEAFAGLSGTVGIALASRGARRTVGLTWRTDREPGARGRALPGLRRRVQPSAAPRLIRYCPAV
ncbi:LysR substrate-binding domain-containing protein [Nocardioides convexus]|uniref:LysR substrate-binding domain-containing protein n=1 Tax=Nocardioides convexus TaxID=2712224 RepID=UPI0024189459|nr:LysR substrate-binding domain-containing protein [Nocardioides convexus]